MSGWSRHSGLAVALDRENVDTDQLIPARFMSTPRADGYGQFLLHDLRGDDPGFPLNRSPDASILVAGRNFGCGSSREAAVYALVDFGIRAVLAPSFGEIFEGNAINNGLLPARIDSQALDQVFARLSGGTAEAEIDLAAGTATVAGLATSFTLDSMRREKLINGWDDIDLTHRHRNAIDDYRAARAGARPWSFPSEASAG